MLVEKRKNLEKSYNLTEEILKEVPADHCMCTVCSIVTLSLTFLRYSTSKMP